MDALLDILSRFDVIDWLHGVYGRGKLLAQGRGWHTIRFIAPAGRSGASLGMALAIRGVDVYGRSWAGYETVNGKQERVLSVIVSQRQARWAERIITTCGGQVVNPLDPAAVNRAQGKPAPRPWHSK